jgi:iron-sulfur cluster insertion protein
MSAAFHFKVTTNAQRRILHLISSEEKPELKLRITVDSGGCSGLLYRYELTSSINQDDQVFEIETVSLIIDRISQPFLSNSTLDYVETLGNSYFQIINPNATLKCGCGNSFAV